MSPRIRRNLARQRGGTAARMEVVHAPKAAAERGLAQRRRGGHDCTAAGGEGVRGGERGPAPSAAASACPVAGAHHAPQKRYLPHRRGRLRAWPQSGHAGRGPAAALPQLTLFLSQAHCPAADMPPCLLRFSVARPPPVQARRTFLFLLLLPNSTKLGPPAPSASASCLHATLALLHPVAAGRAPLPLHPFLA